MIERRADGLLTLMYLLLNKLYSLVPYPLCSVCMKITDNAMLEVTAIDSAVGTFHVSILPIVQSLLFLSRYLVIKAS